MVEAPVQDGAISLPTPRLQEFLDRGFHLGDWWVQPEDGLLVRDEERAHLRPRQMELLVFLACHADDVVTKKRLFAEVWHGAAVEDGALPRCVSELRAVLGDRAQNPTYIATIPRRGYRVVAPVTIGETSPSQPAPGTPVENVPPPAPVPPRASTPRQHRHAMASFGVLAVIACAVFFLSNGQRAGAPTWAAAEPNRVTQASQRGSTAVLGFRNLSGEPQHDWLSEALSEMLTSELALSPELRLVPGEAIARVKRALSIDNIETQSVEAKQRLRDVLGAERIVFGSYLALEDKDGTEQLRIDLWIEGTDTAEAASSMVERGPSSDLFELVTLLGIRLRERMGMPSSFSDDADGLRRNLPHRASSARLYFRGLHELRHFRADRARELLEEAIAEEPDQPLPYLALSEAWSALGYDARALQAAERAQQRSAELPRELRLWVEGGFLQASSRWDDAIAVYRALWVFSPANIEYGYQLASVQLAGGRPLQALATLDQVQELGSIAASDPRLDLMAARCHAHLGDHPETLAASERAIDSAKAIAAVLVVARARQIQAQSLHALGRFEETVEAIRASIDEFSRAGDRGSASWARTDLARWLATRGQFARAEALAQASLEVFVEIGKRRGEAVALQILSMIEAERGNLEGSKATLARVLLIQREIGSVRGEAGSLNDLGSIHYRLGDLDQAEALFERALALHRQVGSADGINLLLTNLGCMLGLKGKSAAALEIFRESLTQAQELDDPNLISLAQLNLGNSQLFVGNLDAAEHAFSAARTIWDELENPNWLASALDGLAETAAERGSFRTAREWLETAIDLKREIGDKDGLATSRATLARIEIDEGRFAEAERLARQALEDAGSNTPSAAMAHGALIRSLMAQARPRDALRATEKARALLSADKTPNVYQIRLMIEIARTHAVHADADRQLHTLRRILRNAQLGGAWVLAAEADLAIAEINLRAAPSSTTRARLETLAADARARGYLVRARAAQALASSSELPHPRPAQEAPASKGRSTSSLR